jgi:hypothetical protein
MRRLVGHVLLGNDRGRLSVPVCAIVIVVASLLLFVLQEATLFDACLLVAIALAVIITLIAIVLDDQMALSSVKLALTGGLILICLTLSFGGVYYRESQLDPKAYNVRLDRLAAVYLAIGTLSTNGAGGVQARSSKAQAEMMLQETADLTVVALFFTTLMRRLGYRSRITCRGRDQHADDGLPNREPVPRIRNRGGSTGRRAKHRPSRPATRQVAPVAQIHLHLIGGTKTLGLPMPCATTSNDTYRTTTNEKGNDDEQTIEDHAA